jgi:hypothetical protein
MELYHFVFERQNKHVIILQCLSNIQGLGQIRFPSGNIKACFEEIRQVLEREGLL